MKQGLLISIHYFGTGFYNGITENKSERGEGEQCRYSAIPVSLDSARVAEN